LLDNTANIITHENVKFFVLARYFSTRTDLDSVRNDNWMIKSHCCKIIAAVLETFDRKVLAKNVTSSSSCFYIFPLFVYNIK
jgi:hypothetical protein